MDDIINHSATMQDTLSPSRRVQRVRHELKRRDLRVARVEALSPGFAAVTFAGPSLSDFASDSFDDHVKLMLDTGGAEPARRDYTPRRFDRAACELTIEFALHGEGAASDWARQARAGQEAVVGGPRGSMVIPVDWDWHLLAGDDTALPAIRRRLEELPAGSRVTVVAQADAADRLPFATQARLDLHWVDSDEAMLAAVRALPLPAGEGFAWAAGEAAAMARLRQVLREEKGIAKEAMRVAAYWKRGATAHHENLED